MVSLILSVMGLRKAFDSLFLWPLATELSKVSMNQI